MNTGLKPASVPRAMSAGIPALPSAKRLWSSPRRSELNTREYQGTRYWFSVVGFALVGRVLRFAGCFLRRPPFLTVRSRPRGFNIGGHTTRFFGFRFRPATFLGVRHRILGGCGGGLVVCGSRSEGIGWPSWGGTGWETCGTSSRCRGDGHVSLPPECPCPHWPRVPGCHLTEHSLPRPPPAGKPPSFTAENAVFDPEAQTRRENAGRNRLLLLRRSNSAQQTCNILFL